MECEPQIHLPQSFGRLASLAGGVRRAAKRDVNHQEIGDYLSLHVVYNSDVYEKGMVEDLIHHYRELLNALLANPEEKVSPP